MSEYSEMTYGDLQKLAKERGLAANGQKEELIARLEAAPAAISETEPEQPEGDVEPEEETEPEQPAAPAAPITDQKVEKEWRGDAAKMKAHLDKQKKVSVMIPLEQGVSAESAEKIPFVVNLNGYRYSVKRGVFVEVPMQIAEIIKERLESEGKIGSEYRLDRNQAKQDALG